MTDRKVSEKIYLGLPSPLAQKQANLTPATRKLVCFCPDEPEIKFFSLEERYGEISTWYSKSEYDTIRGNMLKDVKTLVQKIYKNKVLDADDRYLMTGIEKYISKVICKYAKRERFEYVDAALNDQEGQQWMS